MVYMMRQKVFLHDTKQKRSDLAFLALDTVSKDSICEVKQKEIPINDNFGPDQKRKGKD